MGGRERVLGGREGAMKGPRVGHEGVTRPPLHLRQGGHGGVMGESRRES